MSLIHQAELVMIILCFMVAFLQSQDMLWEQWEPWMEDCPSKTQWKKIIPHAGRNWVYVHVLGLISKFVAKGWIFFWTWLGGL